jgi:hypothetical protein
MNWRAVLLSSAFASALTLSFVPQAAAKHDRYSRDDGGCSQIFDRIELDRSKIDEIGPTGRHRKALQWYQDDLRNAQRDLDRCRYGDETASYDPDPYYRTQRAYDPYYGSGRYDSYDDSSRYDPYDDVNGDQSFDWKRDWPMLLGIFLPNQ